MAQPTPYNRQFNFANFQTTAPTTPLPAAQVELELNSSKQTLDEILNNLALIQKDDGTLANLSVGRDQLAAGITVGFDAPTAWAASTSYTLTSTVYFGGVFYSALEAHTSSAAFATDSAKWSQIADFNEIASIQGLFYVFDDSVDTGNAPATGQWRANNADPAAATTLALHISSNESGNPDVSAFFDRWLASTTTPKGQLFISQIGAGENRIEYAVVDVTDQGGFYTVTVTGGAKTGTFVDGQLCSILFVQGHDLDTSSLMTTGFENAVGTIPTDHLDASVVNGLLPVGTVISWPSDTLPSSNWLFVNGQTIGNAASGADQAHDDHEELFNIVKALPPNAGTEVFANGDTVALPDACGRVIAGQDDAGGIASKNRLTDQAGGLNGDTLGDTGGAETHTLTEAQLPAHNHPQTAQTPTLTYDVAETAGGAGAVRVTVIQTSGGSNSVNTNPDSTPGNTGNTGSGEAHNNVQPTIVLNWIILARRTALSSITPVGLGERLYRFSTTQSKAVPGNGFVRVNAAPASATRIWIDNEDGSGTSLAATLQAIGDSTSTTDKGHIEVHNLTQPGKFARYTISSQATDETGYVEIVVVYESGDGANDFALNDQIALFYVPRGDKGDNGQSNAVIAMQWNTATAGDPGDGKMRGNAAQASITQLAIDDVDANSQNIEALIQALDNSTSGTKAHIHIFDPADTSKWVFLSQSTAWSDQTGYWTATVAVEDNGGTIANNTNVSVLVIPVGDKGDTGAAGPATVPNDSVRVATTANGTLATAYENGDTIDGIVLATGDLILLKDQSAPAENGVYVVAASGAPARDGDYDTYDEHPGKLISVQEGTANADTLWLCTSNLGGTLDTTAIAFTPHVPDASEATPGLVEIASTAEAQAGSDDLKAMTPAKVQDLQASAANINTGTSTTQVVSPDALAGSNFGTMVIPIVAFDSDVDVAVGDNPTATPFLIPSTLNGMNIVAVEAAHTTASGASGGSATTDVQIRRVRSGAAVDVLTTKLTIDRNELDSSSAATAAAINASNDDLSTFDQIFVDVDTVAGTTVAQGLMVNIHCRLP